MTVVHDWRVCFGCGVLLRACLVPPAARNVVLSGGAAAVQCSRKRH
jgi:hypothetical protein